MKKKLGIISLTLVVLMISLMLGKMRTTEQVIFINEVRSWDTSAIREGYYGSDRAFGIEVVKNKIKSDDISGNKKFGNWSVLG